MLGGLIGAGAGLLGLGAAAAGGIGKNDTRAKTFAESGQYDANRFEWGGRPGGADADAARFGGLAAGAQGRQGERVNYADANWDRMQAGQARIGQQGLADAMGRRAYGQTPSIAQMQADRQMQQAAASQASAAASARGPAGLALAQQNAANNVATMQSAVSNQAQINAAQERMQAEQAAFGAYSGMRGGDMASQQQAAQQAQYQAQLNAQQRAQNDQYSQGLYANEMAVRNAQLGAGQNQQGLMAGSHGQATNTNVGISQANANWEMGLLKGAMGGAQGGADALTAGGAGGGGKVPGRASGGPVQAGKPYIVGELGPELIVPSASGTVIPSGPTQGLLGAAGLGSYPGSNAGSGPGQASFDKLKGDGSMDVLGSLKAHSDFATRFASDPTGGMGGRGLL